MRATDRITLLNDGISQRQVEETELDDKIPDGFGKDKRVWIKFKEIGYKSILIAGMTAGIKR